MARRVGPSLAMHLVVALSLVAVSLIGAPPLTPQVAGAVNADPEAEPGPFPAVWNSSTQVFRNQDGTLTATIYADSIQAPDPNSETDWSPVDTDLTPSPEGLVTKRCSGGAIGDFYTFRVRTIGGQGGPYEAHVQCPGGGWQHLATWDGPPNGDDDGKPMVEAGRQGPNTGLSDHHHDLKFRDANNQWYSWAGMECHLDDNSAWNGYKVPGETDHFETRKASGTC